MDNLEGEIVPALELVKWLFGQSSHTYPAITFALVEKLLGKMGNEKDRATVHHIKSILTRQMEELLGYRDPDLQRDDAARNVADDDVTHLHEQLSAIRTSLAAVEKSSSDSPASSDSAVDSADDVILTNGAGYESCSTSTKSDDDVTLLRSIERRLMAISRAISADGLANGVAGPRPAVFLFPPMPSLPPFHREPCATPFSFQYAAVFNSLGLPVTCCPLGRSRQATPLAVQVVAGWGRDRLALAVARELEAAFGGWVQPAGAAC